MTTEEQIKQMYEAQLNSQKEQLATDYQKAASDLDYQKSQNQKNTDQNLNRTAVEAQKSAVSNEEYYNASGLSSGAKAQARLSQENQALANMTAIRTAQQEADAQIERNRSLLANEYAAAIRKAQAENDFAKAQALYQEAQRQEDILRDNQQKSASLMAQSGDFSQYKTLYGLTDEQIAALTQMYNTEKEETNKQKQNEQLAAAAQLMAQAGDFSLYKTLYGLTDEQVALLKKNYELENGQTVKTGSIGSTGDTGDRYETDTGPEQIDFSGSPDNGELTKDQVQQLQAALGITEDGLWGPQSREKAYEKWGVIDPDAAFEKAYGHKAGELKVTSDDNGLIWTDQWGSVTISNPDAKELVEELKRMQDSGETQVARRELLYAAYADDGLITKAEYLALLPRV
jgi:hypothetical protein